MAEFEAVILIKVEDKGHHVHGVEVAEHRYYKEPKLLKALEYSVVNRCGITVEVNEHGIKKFYPDKDQPFGYLVYLEVDGHCHEETCQTYAQDHQLPVPNREP